MSEQIRIPKQRNASRSKQAEERCMSDDEVYAAQQHHQEVDARADDVLDEIEDLVAEVEASQQLRFVALGELAVAA